MKKIKILIAISCILIIVLIVGLILLKNQNEKNDEPDGILEYDENGFTDIQESELVNQCINKYFAYANKTNNILGNNYTENEVEQERRKGLINLLDKEYINSNNITENNIENYIDVINENDSFDIKNIKVKYSSKIEGGIETYIIKGELNKNNSNYQKNYILRIDYGNLTFSIEPLKDEKDIQINENTIEKNSYNKFKM